MPACSYCGNITHNIRNCDNPFIHVYYVNIKYQYLDCINLNPVNPQLIFTTSVSRIYNLSIIKAVSVKFTNSPAYLNKTSHLIKLFEHFSHMGTNSAFRTPDPIPSYAQDLNAEYEAPEEIHWFIDRMPTPNLLLSFNSQRISIPLELLNEYIQAVDEFIPISRDLNNEFDSSLSTKKYCITPILSLESTNSNDMDLEEDCPICYEQIGSMDSVRLNCNHKFCGSCIISTLSHHRVKDCSPSCALCRQPITNMITKNNDTFNNISEFCIL
jgi:hypothetical protein